MEGAMSPREVSNHLGLDELKGRNWQIFKTSAITGEGLQEGLDWYYPISLSFLHPESKEFNAFLFFRLINAISNKG